MTIATRIPIIRLYGNLIVSIQVSLSDDLVVALKEDITQNIGDYGARGLIIDLSGIDLMDSYISRSIRDIALISKLMGAQTVISGMDPLVAMTLVEMGLEMNDVRTALTLEDAIDLLGMERVEADDAAFSEFILAGVNSRTAD
ncbi:MAG: STAS domain-containing protein [Deltaproteobacteria bacterium]|nr:STAS domain-containing protein [Deltaproteobacteria bacterium]